MTHCSTALHVRPASKGLPTENLQALSLCFNGYFSRWTWVSRYQNVSILDFVAAKGDGGRGDNWSYKQTCKAPVKSLPPTNWHPTFYRRMPFLSPNQQCQSMNSWITISYWLDVLVIDQSTAPKHWWKLWKPQNIKIKTYNIQSQLTLTSRTFMHSLPELNVTSIQPTSVKYQLSSPTHCTYHLLALSIRTVWAPGLKEWTRSISWPDIVGD